MTSLPGRGSGTFNPATVVGVVAVVVIFLVLVGGLDSLGSDALSVVIVGAVLTALTVPFAHHLARVNDDPRLVALVMGGWGVKVVGSIARYAVLHQVYDGVGDAERYFHNGVDLAQQFGGGDLHLGTLSGTHFIEVLSGFLYLGLPDNQMAGFLVFAWIGFLGLLLFTQALRVAMPGAAHLRYALLIVLMPTLVFWPASIGKEAFMMLALGMSAYGAALLLASRWRGLVWLGLGLWGAAVVRPHMALIVLVALIVAWPFRSVGRNQFGLSPLLRVLGVGLLVLLLLVVVQRSEQFFGIESLSQEGASEVLESTTDQTGIGGSEYDAPRVDNVLDIPWATVTVLFRPFVWEASSTEQRLVGLEALAVLALLVASVPRFLSWAGQRRNVAYAIFCGMYSAAFIIAFSSIANFGILARQRSQLYPLLLVLCCVGPVRDEANRDDDDAHRSPESSSTSR